MPAHFLSRLTFRCVNREIHTTSMTTTAINHPLRIQVVRSLQPASAAPKRAWFENVRAMFDGVRDAWAWEKREIQQYYFVQEPQHWHPFKSTPLRSRSSIQPKEYSVVAVVTQSSKTPALLWRSSTPFLLVVPCCGWNPSTSYPPIWPQVLFWEIWSGSNWARMRRWSSALTFHDVQQFLLRCLRLQQFLHYRASPHLPSLLFTHSFSALAPTITTTNLV